MLLLLLLRELALSLLCALLCLRELVRRLLHALLRLLLQTRHTFLHPLVRVRHLLLQISLLLLQRLDTCRLFRIAAASCLLLLRELTLSLLCALFCLCVLVCCFFDALLRLPLHGSHAFLHRLVRVRHLLLQIGLLLLKSLNASRTLGAALRS